MVFVSMAACNCFAFSGSHAKITKNTRQPLAASSSHPLHYRAPSLPPVAQLATARPHSVHKPLHCISLIAATLADACSGLFYLYWPSRSWKDKNQKTGGLPNTQNIIAKLQVWLPKLTRVRFASLKKSSFFFCPKPKRSKQKEYFLVCPCIIVLQPVAAVALCFGASFVVNWVAGGCSFTYISVPVFAFISCVTSVGSTLSSRGFRSL